LIESSSRIEIDLAFGAVEQQLSEYTNQGGELGRAVKHRLSVI
jgi:hypothetical protein